MKKYDYKEIKEVYEIKIAHLEKDIFILKTIAEVMEKYDRLFNRITIKLGEYLEKLFENNKYHIYCRYNKSTYIGNKKYLFFSNRHDYCFELILEYSYDGRHEKISKESINNMIKRKEEEITNDKNILKTLKTNITKFNKIMDTLDKFYEENKGLNYYLKVKEY